MSEWRPIETAPKDGTDIILMYYSAVPALKNRIVYTVNVCRWVEKISDWNWGCGSSATHWMPLPAPPAEKVAQPTGVPIIDGKDGSVKYTGE